MRTSSILNGLNVYGALELKDIYRVANANTAQEKHIVRGILSNLKKQGKVKNIDRGLWMIV